MNCYGLTDTGVVRKNNEDSFLIKSFGDNIIASVVADGMGGHVGGKTASTIASDTVMELIEDASEKLPTYTDKQYESLLKTIVTKVNKKVYTKSREEAELDGMGTTLVICIVNGCKYHVANVGDSRLYLHSGKLKQITKDHSYVAELVEMGVITEKQAATHPNKNVITRAIGTEKSVIPDTYTGVLKDDDVILTCSDGLSNMVSNEDISSVIQTSKGAQEIASSLVELANKNGGMDNVTAVVLKQNEIGGGDTL